MLFKYKAKNDAGQIRQGEIEAKNPHEAYAILKKEGYIIVSINAADVTSKKFWEYFRSVSLKDLAIFTKQLEVMIKAGLSIVAALNAQAEQTENKKLSGIASKLAKKVSGGTSLSSALSDFPSVFSSIYINTVKSGEESGKLEAVLNSLTTQLEKDYDLQSKIKGAMVYPAFILFALVIVIIIVFIYVIPSLTQMFKEMGGTLPISTRMLIYGSELIIKFWWVMLITIIGLMIVLKYYSKTTSGRLLYDKIKIKAPIFGKLVVKNYLARFCQTSSTLIKAGLPIVKVIKSSKDVINNTLYQNDLDIVAKKVENGVPFSKALKESSYFPKMVSHLLSIGENSGKMEESFDTLADYYSKEVETMTATLSTLIEPVLIVIIGVAVAFVIISVIGPIYNLSKLI